MIKKIKQLLCKHEETYTSSCPYTGKTYTGCKKCLKWVREVYTK